MAYVNMESIIGKAKKYMGGSKGIVKQQRILRKAVLGKIKLDGVKSSHTPIEAAKKFIEVLESSINGASLSDNAKSALLGGFDYNIVSGGNDCSYIITINFKENLSRPSLDPSHYKDGIGNLAALFNNGVDHTMKQVHGYWHEKETWSRTTISGTNFMQEARDNFMGNYAEEYNVLNVELSSDYE